MVFSMSLEFLLSAFLRRKHFSLEPFPRTCSSCCYYCLLHSTCATRPLFHFLRSPVESSASRRWLVAAESLSWKCGRPERQGGASLTGAAVTRRQQAAAGQVEGVTASWEGEAPKKSRGKGVKRARGALGKGQDAGSRHLAGGAPLPSPGKIYFSFSWF